MSYLKKIILFFAIVRKMYYFCRKYLFMQKQNFALIKRYALIVEKLNSRYAPSLRNIADYLAQAGVDVTIRTVQRYIRQLRDEFGLEIVYQPETNTYRIDTTEYDHFEALLRLIHLADTTDLLMQSLKDKKLLSVLSFQNSQHPNTGSQYLETLITAIRDSRLVSFEYDGFSTKKQSKQTVKPVMLKEYSDKWYLVAYPDIREDLRIYCLDRILDKPTILDKKFSAKKYADVPDKFDHVIGLVYDLEEIAEVRLSAVPEQARYFIKTPLHHSQQIESESETEVIFTYTLIPNLELQRLILGFGSRVKVLGPKKFARQVEDEIAKMLGVYKKRK
jgi:predicted DNA-binding transcriptional regulator YafY